MIVRLFWVALIAGAAAGLFAAAVQAFGVWPLIADAEVFEEAAEAAAATAGHEHAAAEWSPEGAWRVGFSVLFNVLAGIGFALLANAGLLAVRALRNVPLDWRAGLAIGGAGFAAFSLAPAFGLAPALPGMAEGDLLARQSWWIATAIATLAGVASMALAVNVGHWLLGLALLALPHILGAPGDGAGLLALMSMRGPLGPSGLTAELAQRFALGSLAAAAAFWIVLGLLSASLQRRFLRDA